LVPARSDCLFDNPTADLTPVTLQSPHD